MKCYYNIGKNELIGPGFLPGSTPCPHDARPESAMLCLRAKPDPRLDPVAGMIIGQ